MSRVAVVIPVFNSADTLSECLDGLSTSVKPVDELIVVDDGSNDEQAGLIAALVLRHGGRLFRQLNSGPSAARNLGARQATAETLIFLDADVCVHPDTIGALASAFDDPSLDAVFGSYDDRPDGGSVVSDFRNLLHHFVHQRSRRAATTFWAGCGAIRRDLFLRTGFDERYTKPSIEDVALGAQLSAAGHRIELRPQIQVTHLKRWTLGSFLRTDLFSRAIPWTRMMLAPGGSLPQDLNFGFAHRASTLLSGLLPLCLLLAIRLPLLGLTGAAACVLLLALLNRAFLTFLSRRRGVWFALRAFPLHIAHYACGGVGFVAGCLAEWRERDPQAGVAAVVIAGMALTIQLVSGTYLADFQGHADEASHFVGGVLLEQYLHQPLGTSPMAFAEQYYLHHPRFAIGHWPPGLYLIEGAWFTFFGGSRTAALLLEALFSFVLVLGVYAWIRTRTEYLPALAGALLLMVSVPLQLALGVVLADSLTALVVLAATFAFSMYVARPSAIASLLFGLLAAIAMLIKGSAVPLLIVPALVILLARRFELLRRPDLWMSALPVLVLAGPWYLFARNFDTPNHSSLFHPRTIEIFVTWLDYPVAMLLLAVVAVVLLDQRQPDVAALTALAASYTLVPMLVPHFSESRHVLPGAAGIAILAGWGIAQTRQWAPAVAAAAFASLFLHGGLLLHYPLATIRPWVANLKADEFNAERVLLAGFEDGPVVAALTEYRPDSKQIVLRSSRILARSGWGGNNYSLQVRDTAETRERLKELGIGAVLVPISPTLPHEYLLANVMKDWIPQPSPAGLRLYISPQPPDLKPVEIEQRRLRHTIRTTAPAAGN